MKLVIIGTGFVGVTSSAVYASFGHQVYGVDVDEGKIASLSRGEVPFYEPKLAPLLQSGLSSGNLHFTTSYREAIEGAHIVIFAVGTPSREDGSIDLQYLETSLKQAADYLQPQTIVAIKSTVLPGTLDLVKKIVSERCPHQLHYASLPEFLKEGSAVDDTLYPDRVVIGVEDDFTYRLLEQLHAPLKAPLLRVSPASAQLAKYASNDYLALRIVYANVISEICHHAGADIDEVLAIMGSEKRIGSHYWYPGLGYGGSCFPKDVKALAAYTKQFLSDSENLFAFINGLNNKRPLQVLNKLEQTMGGFHGKKIAVLGLSFKPNTDDQREAPALFIIPYLLEHGAVVTSYDPMVKAIASETIGSQPNYRQLPSIAEAVAGADAIIALIEWQEIISFDFSSVKEAKKQYLFDVRNQLIPEKIKLAGFYYLGNGRYSK